MQCSENRDDQVSIAWLAEALQVQPEKLTVSESCRRLQQTARTSRLAEHCGCSFRECLGVNILVLHLSRVLS